MTVFLPIVAAIATFLLLLILVFPMHFGVIFFLKYRFYLQLSWREPLKELRLVQLLRV